MTGREAFGVELRRRRVLAELSLAQLAERVHYSKGHLSKIESGSQSANATFARMCDAALGANGELVALVAAPTPAAADRDDDGLDDDFWTVRLDPDGTGHFAPVAGHGPDFAATATTFGPNFAAGQYPVDPDVAIPLFRGRFDQARLLGQLVNSALTLPMLIAETHILRSIASTAPADSGAGLWRLAAHYAEYLGWMSQESGSNRHALYWTKVAVRMAIRGGYESLRPFALVREADMTLHEDDAHQTIELSRQAAADTAADSRIRGLAAQREAQGYALLGDQEACLRTLDRSARLLDEVPNGPGPMPALGSWRTPDMSLMVRGWCLYDLGRPAEAAAVLESGIGGFPDGASRAKVRYAVRTALAHATADEVERSCEIVEWLAADLRQIDSATVRHDVRLLHREFRRRAGQPRVRELLPLLADLMRGPNLDRE